MREDSHMLVRSPDALELQAHEWLRRLKSGTARVADAQALARWCATSEQHAQAFKNAQRMWNDLLPAATLAGMNDPELAKLRAPLRNKEVVHMPRRAFLGGAVAVAAVTGIALIRPPLDLWPSAADVWQSDYRTATGEQRGLDLANGVKVEMNTRSSISVQASRGETVGINLMSGEVAVDATRPDQSFTVNAAGGHTSGRDARFELRYLGDEVCVTCVAGSVQVMLAGNEVRLHSAQQVIYDKNTIQPIRNINLGDVSAWRDGVLSFQQTALSQVVTEINRYRPGRVVLLAKQMNDKPVSGRFNIRDLDKAIAQIQRLFRLDVTSLPGGVVILK